MSRHPLPLLLLACLLVPMGIGCDASPAEPDVGGPDLAAPDLMVVDAAPVADAAIPDAAPPRACLFPADCPRGDCVEGFCLFDVPQRCQDDAPCPVGEVCGGREHRFYCAYPCELDGGCARRTWPCEDKGDCRGDTNCKAGRCINDCVNDDDCHATGYCMEGECIAYPDILGGTPLGALAPPGQVWAGVGVAPVNYPMGVSQAGYGGRSGKATPYNFSLGGTDRVFDHQDGRVLVLSTDDDTLIVLRLPIGWSTDYLRTLIAVKVQRLTRSPANPDGINVLEKLVTVATHSHSGPGRFWNLLPTFGVFGHGNFSPEMIDRYATSFAQAIKFALDDLQPARFGYTLIDDFDPDSHIHRDRRGENPEFKDGRLMVWRIEDADGRPMMGAINFAMHGTHMQETWMTGDVAGGLERIVSDKLSAESGRSVPVMFLNGNAGNVSPGGDANTNVPWGKIQTLGHLVWPVFRAAWDEAQPRDDIQLEVVARRIPVNYDLLGYDRTVPDFRDDFGDPYIYGGFSCVPDSRPDNPYQDGMLGCRMNLDSFLGHPPVQAHKTAIAAFRIDNLVVATLPGESTSELGVMLSSWIRADAAAAGLQAVDVANFGYSQDHQLYLLTAEDWFRGGYEASQNWFGWNLGEYIAGESRKLTRQLFTAEIEDNNNGMKPSWWPNLADDRVQPTETRGIAGSILVNPVSQVERGTVVEVQWNGGHPGVDLPWVVLEKQNVRGGFGLVYRSPGVVLDAHGFEALTLYYGNYEQVHTWGAKWEFPFDFPEGVYRLRAVGKVWQGLSELPYDTASEPFTLTPARMVVHRRSIEGRTVTAAFTYPDGPTNDSGQNVFDGLDATGHLLRVDPFWRLGGVQRAYAFILGQPVSDPEVTITVPGGDGAYRLVAEPTTIDRVLVTARDAAGVEQTTTIPDWPAHEVQVDLPGPGRYTVYIDDAYGNRATVSVAAEENR